MFCRVSDQAFLPINPKMIIPTLTPMAVPEAPPAVRMSSAGSVDCGAIVSIMKKNPTAAKAKNKPVITTRQFLRRIVPKLLHL
jgi:hypothetical protein